MPMDTDDRQGAVGGTGFVLQASAGGVGAAAVSATQPHHMPGGQTGSHQRGSFHPGDAVCVLWTASLGRGIP